MGKPININRCGDNVYFSLTNKRTKEKERIIIITDAVSFEALIEGTGCWYLKNQPKGIGGFYVARMCLDTGNNIFLHREVVSLRKDVPPYGSGFEIDHINRYKLDCRYRNLRIVTKYENNLNQSRVINSKSIKYKGLFICEINKNGRRYYQVCKGKKYICCRSSIKEVKKRIDIYLNERGL